MRLYCSICARLLSLTMTMAIIIPGQAQRSQDRIRLFVTFSHISSGEALLRWADSTGSECVARASIANRKCILTGPLAMPTMAVLSVSRIETSIPRIDSLNLFIDPGTMKIRVKEDNWTVSVTHGGNTQKLFSTLETTRSPYRKIQDSVLHRIRADKGKSATASSSLEDSIRINADLRVIEFTQLKIMETDISFIKEHPSSYLGPYLLPLYMDKLPLDTVDRLYKLFPTAVRNTLNGKQLGLMIKSAHAVAIGQPAPEIQAVDLNKQSITLSKLVKNKVLILDFWASWCKPCRQLTPYIKMLQQKFGIDQIQIIGISLDFDQDSWKQAIAEDSVATWTQVYGDLKNAGAPGNIITDYNVQAIPDIVVIDKSGNIAGRFKGSEKFPDIEILVNSLVGDASSK